MHASIPCTYIYIHLFYEQYTYQSSIEITSYAYFLALNIYIFNTHHIKVASVVLIVCTSCPSLQYTMCMYRLIARDIVYSIYKYLSYMLQSLQSIRRTTAVQNSTEQCSSMVNALVTRYKY